MGLTSVHMIHISVKLLCWLQITAPSVAYHPHTRGAVACITTQLSLKITCHWPGQTWKSLTLSLKK